MRPGGPPAARLNHNCSGKHAGMLAALPSAAAGRTGATGSPSHRCSRRSRARSPTRPSVAADEIPTAVDGCGVLDLRAAARADGRAFSRLEGSTAATRVAAAMRAHPELIGGAGRADTRLMRGSRAGSRRAAPRGSMCAALPGRHRRRAQGRGRRTTARSAPRSAAFLEPLGSRCSALARAADPNSRGETCRTIDPRAL